MLIATARKYIDAAQELCEAARLKRVAAFAIYICGLDLRRTAKTEDARSDFAQSM